MCQEELYKTSQQTEMPEAYSEFPNLEELLAIDELEPEVIDDFNIGIVTNCVKLNIHEKPRADAPIVCEVGSKTKLMIVEVESTEGFFKVYTAAGLEGFCMKKFITVPAVKENHYGEYTDIN